MNSRALVRHCIVAVGVIGTLLFGAAFLASIINPGYVEKIGRELIRIQVEKEVKETIDRIDADFLTHKAAGFMKAAQADMAQAKAALQNNLPEKISRATAEMSNLDCDCRKKIERNLREGYLYQIGSAAKAQERLDTLIRTRYMETAELLMREYRIFTLGNAAVFALLALAALVRRKADIHLIPVALVLLGAAGITASLYLFNQDWLRTIVFGDYVGLAYLAYLGVAGALLSDVVFNRGRVICTVLRNSSISVSPC